MTLQRSILVNNALPLKMQSIRLVTGSHGAQQRQSLRQRYASSLPQPLVLGMTLRHRDRQACYVGDCRREVPTRAPELIILRLLSATPPNRHARHSHALQRCTAVCPRSHHKWVVLHSTKIRLSISAGCLVAAWYSFLTGRALWLCSTALLPLATPNILAVSSLRCSSNCGRVHRLFTTGREGTPAPALQWWQDTKEQRRRSVRFQSQHLNQLGDGIHLSVFGVLLSAHVTLQRRNDKQSRSRQVEQWQVAFDVGSTTEAMLRDLDGSEAKGCMLRGTPWHASVATGRSVTGNTFQRTPCVH